MYQVLSQKSTKASRNTKYIYLHWSILFGFLSLIIIFSQSHLEEDPEYNEDSDKGGGAKQDKDEGDITVETRAG